MSSDSVQDLERKQGELRAALALVTDMRPGSLVQRYVRCGKPNCHCARKGDPGHGPIWSVTHEVAGKTITKTIPASAVEMTRRQIAAYRSFKDLTKQLTSVSERLCDARLTQTAAASEQEVKKGPFRRSSRQRSSRKSTN